MKRFTVIFFIAGTTVAGPMVHDGLAATHEVTVANAARLDTLLGTVSLAGTAADGDRIHIASGIYRAPANGWFIRRSLELFGDGAGDLAGSATRLKPFQDGHPVLVLKTPDRTGTNFLENVFIRDLQIRQDAKPTVFARGGNGIVWQQLAGTRQRNIGNLRLARLMIANMAGDGINLTASDSADTYLVGASITDVDVRDCLGHGLAIYRGTVVYILGGYYHLNGKTGADLSSCVGARIIGSSFESNGGNGLPELELASSNGFMVEGNHFEQFDSGGPGAIRVGGVGGYIGSNVFVNVGGPARATTGIHIGSDPPMAQGIVVGPNWWTNVNTLIAILDSDSVRSCVVMPQTVSWSPGVASRIVVPEAPDRGHIVHASTSNTSNLTAGLALPGLSAAKRDAMTAASSGGTRRDGLFVYNDGTKRLNHWDGSRWVEEVAYFPSGPTPDAPPGGINLPGAIDAAARNRIPSEFRSPGALIYNSETRRLNYWDGSAWKEVAVKE